MTPEQCKAGRAIAGVSQKTLADAAKVAAATIGAFEQGRRTPYPRTMADIRAALEAYGVQFTAHGVQTAQAGA